MRRSRWPCTSHSTSPVLVLAIAVPAAGFLLRTYMVFHDCAHGSFLPSRRANTWLGRVLGLLVFTSFDSWRHSHAVRHATAGDLDRRGVGDVLTRTVGELEVFALGHAHTRGFRYARAISNHTVVLWPRLTPHRVATSSRSWSPKPRPAWRSGRFKATTPAAPGFSISTRRFSAAR
jgi:fatty acid desaturase